MIRRPPRSTRTDTLFPYTTLFLSDSGTVQAIPSPPASLAIHSNDNDGAHRGDWRQISAVPVRQRSEQLGIFDSPPGNGYLSPPPAPMSQRGTVDRWSLSSWLLYRPDHGNASLAHAGQLGKIGNASRRERVWWYV